MSVMRGFIVVEPKKSSSGAGRWDSEECTGLSPKQATMSLVFQPPRSLDRAVNGVDRRAQSSSEEAMEPRSDRGVTDWCHVPVPSSHRWSDPLPHGIYCIG